MNINGIASKKAFLYFVIYTCIFFAFGITVRAQGGRPVRSIDRRIETLNRQAKEYERDSLSRDTRDDADRVVSAKRAKLIKAEIEDDLNGLQSEYNEIVTALQTKVESIDNFAMGSAAAVRKRAIRLKANLALPEADDDKEKDLSEHTTENTRQSLKSLCMHIYAFITNPIFDAATGFDLKQAAKAHQDLGKVIDLSGRISKVSENPK